MSALTLTGFRDSVYTRAVRMALAGVDYAYVECNPFAPEGQAALAALHPFGRVPVLSDGAFHLYETAAILGYLDDMGHASLTPEAPQARARMRQVMGIADSYVYLPLVRQVFSHVIYRPLVGEAGDPEVIDAGLAAAGPALAALDQIAGEGLVLEGQRLTQADCLLAPMIDYFALTPQGRAALAQHTALSRWFEAVSAMAAFQDTRPAFIAQMEARQ